MNPSVIRTAATTAVLIVLCSPSAPAHAAAPGLSAPRVVAGEKLVLEARVSGPPRRIVTLQRRSGSHWNVVLRTRSATRGTTTLTTRQPSSTKTYRVVAPRSGKHRTITTRSLRAVPLRQQLRVSVPVETTTRSTVPVVAVLEPARARRPWTVQTSSFGGPWRLVASGRLDAKSRLAANVTVPAHADPVSVRITVEASGGAAAVSATRVVQVTAAAPIPDGRPSVVTVSGDDVVAERAHVGGPSVSSDGRYVAFASPSKVLAGVEANGMTQVFVRDTVAGTTRLVSRSASGVLGDEASSSPVISGDGRSVVFVSRAGNLVPGDADGQLDIYVVDLSTGAVQLLSASRGAGGEGNSFTPDLSANGRYVTFVTDDRTISGSTNQASQAVLLDRRDGSVRTVSRSAGGSFAEWPAAVPRVADNGRVAFASQAANLTPSDTNGVSDLFLWDPETEEVTNATGHASVGTFGRPGTFDINPVGDFVAVSTAARLVSEDTDDVPDVYRWEVAAGREGLRLIASERSAYSPRISDDGRRIVYETTRTVGGATRWAARIVELGSMAQGPVAVRANGHESDADVVDSVLSGDGRVVIYTTSDDDLAGRPLGGVSVLLAQRLGD